MLLLAPCWASAQCNPPASCWLMPPQTSTTLTLKWPLVAGATQYQLRYWESSDPGDKTIVDDCGPIPFTLRGLRKNTAYTLQIRSKCGSLTSDWGNPINGATINTSGSCNNLPADVILSAGSSNIDLSWTSTGSHTIRYRLGNSGDWLIIPGALNVMSSSFSITGLSPGMHQVQIKRNCSATASIYLSYNATIESGTGTGGPCLANKNAGKNLSAAGILEINHKCNNPSPFTYGSMIGVNDGGLVFRSFQNETSNQITQLTTQFRNFHTMDEDFNASMQGYELNIKPKDTQPEGTPTHTSYNKGLYTLYRRTHGFSNITGATELLQYGQQSWKEKIYKESDWSAAGPAGIMASYEHYTKKFIDEFAPANGSADQILVANYQVGNELWDYPVKSDYHSLLLGARNAFVGKYGPKSDGKWKMRLMAGAFQAYRDNTCNSILRDFSNCDGGLERHDFIGDYLEVADCDLLKDLDAIDCHPYSFKKATTQWTYPEDPNAETLQIRNLAAWLAANQDTNTGVLQNTHLWSTEFGFDSNPITGVGEKTHSAYLLRGLLLHSRYHFEKVFFYNAFDVARPSDQYYNGLYNSAGFWKLGTHPANGSWASPIAAHGATAKPAWYGMLDFKTRFGEHVFFKSLVEDDEAYVMLIAKPDSSEPYLVFWSPQQT
ncbi:MAG: fibronectin type III domain-containing protein, partial [Phycisphaerae bacterium]|nr:fibronectin type III domain-containing protein [Saprospiraceae bacterium]